MNFQKQLIENNYGKFHAVAGRRRPPPPRIIPLFHLMLLPQICLAITNLLDNCKVKLGYCNE